MLNLVYLVCFVYLVDLVRLVSFVQPTKPDKLDRPDNQTDRALVLRRGSAISRRIVMNNEGWTPY
jgi:hypothetical protein